MTVKLLTEQHLEFLSLKGGCKCSSESNLVKVPNCWKFHVAAMPWIQLYLLGNAVLTEDKQALWTDGRYFLEAEDTLDCNWILMRSGR